MSLSTQQCGMWLWTWIIKPQQFIIVYYVPMFKILKLVPVLAIVYGIRNWQVSGILYWLCRKISEKYWKWGQYRYKYLYRICFLKIAIHIGIGWYLRPCYVHLKFCSVNPVVCHGTTNKIWFTVINGSWSDEELWLTRSRNSIGNFSYADKLLKSLCLMIRWCLVFPPREKQV